MTRPDRSVTTAIDWSEKPEPWRSIGVALAAECRAIMQSPIGSHFSYGWQLRDRRKALGLSQDAVAVLCGWNGANAARRVSAIENGRESQHSRAIEAALTAAEAETASDAQRGGPL